MKAQRGEYGESPVTPIDYPADSPYAVAGHGAVTAQAGGDGSVVAAAAVAASKTEVMS